MHDRRGALNRGRPMRSIESALVVLVPEAEALARSFREKYDPMSTAGTPAHITLIYPFLPPRAIGAQQIEGLRQCFAGFRPLRFSLNRIRRFAGAIYLAPEPEEPFRALTRAIWQRYPEAPPYGGRFPEITPHLTLTQLDDEARLEQIAQEFAEEAQALLPIHAAANEVGLMENSTGAWQPRMRLRLGSG
jgi:2'-5' RNA ligase superfamily